MNDDPLREVCLDSEELFNGSLLHVLRDTVRLPDGREACREYVDHPGAVVIIAELPNGKLVFERQFRYPLDQVFLELPAGKLDPAEEPLAAARRELREETGYVAQHWYHLGVMHPCIGYSNERIEIFFARGLTQIGNQLDDEEFLEILEMSAAEADQAIRTGRLTDGKSIAALYWAQRLLEGRWPLQEGRV